MDISAIIPVYNEGQNIPALYDELSTALHSLGRDYEILLIDDGSNDGSDGLLRTLHQRDPRLRVISFRRNFGQTAAIAAGFHHARGNVLITLDGDLQNDPRDIPLLLAQIDKGYDIVSGWRKNRRDAPVRILASWLANSLISRSLGLRLHDYGCTLKAFRADAIKDIALYGEMHRFIPAVASWNGARIGEVPVSHRPRTKGRSKYGMNRVGRVILDLLLMIFLSGYSTKPLRFFGGLAGMNALLGGISFVVLLSMKLLKGVDMTGNPLLILTALFFLVSMQLFAVGLISEINIRTYYESQKKPIYTIKEVIG